MSVADTHSARSRRAARSLAVIFVFALGVKEAAADEPVPSSPTPSARAQTLFDEAVRLMEQGDYGAACPRLEESQSLDPAGGTALDLGYCYERSGSFARAYRAYDEARRHAVSDGRTDRQTLALQKLAMLAPHVAFVRISLDGDAITQRVEIDLDDARLARTDIGVDRAIEPGEHRVSAKSETGREFSRRFTVLQGGAVAITVAFEAPPPSEARGPLGANETEEPRPTPSRGRRTAAIVTGIAGLSLVGLGLASGGVALARHADANEQCPRDLCTASGLEAERDARAFAWGANVLVVTGLIALGLGTYFFLTTPSSNQKAR